MTTANKKLIGLICSIGVICGALSNAKAAVVDVTLDWAPSFGAQDSAGVALSTVTTNLKLGMFDVVPTDWTSINLSNLSASFKELSSLAYQGTGQQYVFSVDTTLVNADPTLRAQAFLVVTSGSTQLGIFAWNKGLTPFYLPRDPDVAPSDRTSLATNFGTSNYNMSALVGSVSANGIVTASASGAVTSPQSITFGSIPSKSVGDSFALSATASSGLPVTYTSSNPAVATVAGNIVTIVGSGSVVITASQPGNSSFSAATDVPQTITSYASTGLRLASLGTPVLSGSQTTVTHTFVGNPNATYTIEYKSDLSAATWTTITAQTGATGTFTATFTSSGDNVNAWKNRMFFRARNS